MYYQHNHQRGRCRRRTLYKNTEYLSNTSEISDDRQEHYDNLESGSNVMFNHDNNCCKGIEIDLDLNENSTSFLFQLKNMWNMLKKSPPVINMLHQFLFQCTNPYEEILKLIYNCQEFNNAKVKSLPFFIIEEFCSWNSHYKSKNKHLLTSQLKRNAFKVISQQHSYSLTKLVVEIYEMTAENGIFLKIIKCMIHKKKYKEACQCVILLNLQQHFSVQDFLLPMVLQDKLTGIEEFLATSQRHQTEFISFLDSILGKPSVRDAMQTYATQLNVSDLKVEKFHAKPLKKFITRLVKMYKISNTYTPNLTKRRNEGALQFLLHKRYTDNTFGEESWREMVQEAVGDDPELHKELVIQVAFYGDVTGALHWAKFYNVKKEFWPLSLNDDVINIQQTSLQEFETIWPDPSNVSEKTIVEYHKFPLSFNTIILIDNKNKFKHLIETAFKNVTIVGIDCEWKPNFGGQRNELALMQIATRNNVFILDVINLGSHVSYLWQELAKILFHNTDILKLGFGFHSDVNMIKQTLPDLNFTQIQVAFLDLLSLWKFLEKQPNVKLPYEVCSGGSGGLSFSTLVQHCIGRPLDKSDQFSNWEKRPLRESQLIYASLDAYCLIQVYDIIKACCEKVNINFDDACYSLMNNEKLSKHKTLLKKGRHENIPQPPPPFSEPIPVTFLKVVCDTMLQGLGKNLRRCGIDTAILENEMDHMECVRYAQDEGRFILTKGTIYNKLYGYVPKGHCLKILDENVDQQLKEVLNYYKIKVTKDDVFSVCQSCNGKNFEKISYDKILFMKRAVLTQNSKFQENYGFEEDEEVTGFSSDEDCEFEPSFPANSNDNSVNEEILKTKRGIYIQYDSIPEEIINKVDEFYVCEDCGKVYWDGSHLEKVLTGRLQGIVQ